MDARKIYTHLYKLLENSTPIGVDCGQLCGAACCHGDEDAGMYLFPFEECMYDGTEEWLKIYDSDFIFRGKPVKIAICNGTCRREKRPLSCRIFPLFKYDGVLKNDLRAVHICPLAAGNITLEEYDGKFVQNTQKVFNILNKFEITREYIRETEKIINEYKIF